MQLVRAGSKEVVPVESSGMLGDLPTVSPSDLQTIEDVRLWLRGRLPRTARVIAAAFGMQLLDLEPRRAAIS